MAPQHETPSPFLPSRKATTASQYYRQEIPNDGQSSNARDPQILEPRMNSPVRDSFYSFRATAPEGPTYEDTVALKHFVGTPKRQRPAPVGIRNKTKSASGIFWISARNETKMAGPTPATMCRSPQCIFFGEWTLPIHSSFFVETIAQARNEGEADAVVLFGGLLGRRDVLLCYCKTPSPPQR